MSEQLMSVESATLAASRCVLVLVLNPYRIDCLMRYCVIRYYCHKMVYRFSVI